CTRYQYTGAVVSGTKLGVWEHVPFSSEDRTAKRCWMRHQRSVALDYRAGIVPAERAHSEQARWRLEEEKARLAGDVERSQVCRAMVEQMGRWIVRTAVLPPGDAYPFELTALRIGDAFWLAVESEPYLVFQQELRAAFPENPIMIISLAGGCRPSYLPARKAYGTGVYQETIALLEAGSLERLIVTACEVLETLADVAEVE